MDPYTTLGVTKDATQDDIQKAYRRLAKKLHPDLNPGNKVAEDKFKEVSAAYDLLSDPDKRARFDRGEIDASGTEQPRRQYYRDFADQDSSSAYTSNAGFADFAEGGGAGRQGKGAHPQRNGRGGRAKMVEHRSHSPAQRTRRTASRRRQRRSIRHAQADASAKAGSQARSIRRAVAA